MKQILERIKYRYYSILLGFPYGIRGQIELDLPLTWWDKLRYRLYVGESVETTERLGLDRYRNGKVEVR